VGKSRPQISNVMRLLQLQKEVQALVRSGKLSMGHARALLAIESGSVQKSAADRICAKGMSVRQAESHVSALIGRPQRDTRGRQPARREPEIEDLEGRLRMATGTKVKIAGDSSRGRLEIHYFSAEELERLADGILAASKRGR
jgi:ParB family chromosome partitioning protein